MLLYTEGIFHQARLWLNGHPLQGGEHVAGYTSFYRRLDNAVSVIYGNQGAANVLAVEVFASNGTVYMLFWFLFKIISLIFWCSS